MNRNGKKSFVCLDFAGGEAAEVHLEHQHCKIRGADESTAWLIKS